MPANGVNISFNSCQNIAGMARSYALMICITTSFGQYKVFNKGASSYVKFSNYQPVVTAEEFTRELNKYLGIPL